LINKFESLLRDIEDVYGIPPEAWFFDEEIIGARERSESFKKLNALFGISEQ